MLVTLKTIAQDRAAPGAPGARIGGLASQPRQAQRGAVSLNNMPDFRFNPPNHSDEKSYGRSDARPRADGDST
jgi:hypothetical protein